MNSNLLIKNIPLPTMANFKSYWATHFYSIIQTMKYQNNLEYQLNHFISLGSMRGSLPLNFFNSIEQYIKNFGFQYFLVSFLNQNKQSLIVEDLLDGISNIYDIELEDFSHFEFLISGRDSDLTINLFNTFTEYFTPDKKVSLKEAINRSDICLILTNQETEKKVAIFGEVEGLKGFKVRRKSYWDHKNISTFGIGVVEEAFYKKGIYIQELNDKVIITFGIESDIIKDFWHTLSYIKSIFLYGNYSYNSYTRNEDFDFCLKRIIDYWTEPIESLLWELLRYIDGKDLIGNMVEKPLLPIITDLQA